MPAALLKPPFPRLQRGRMLARGLIAAWPMYETSGNVLHNVSGISDLDGTLQNAPQWIGGLQGSALSFNGINQYIALPANPALNIAGPVTFSFWIQITGNVANYPMILGAYDPSSPWIGYGISLNITAPGCIGYWSNIQGAWIDENTAVIDRAWHHIAVSVDAGGKVSFYRDGIPDGVWAGAVPGSWTGTKAIGCLSNGGANFFAGSLSDFRIYNRPLSVAEIREIASGEA